MQRAGMWQGNSCCGVSVASGLPHQDLQLSLCQTSTFQCHRPQPTAGVNNLHRLMRRLGMDNAQRRVDRAYLPGVLQCNSMRLWGCPG